MHVLLNARIGKQTHHGLVQPQSGQRQGGRHIRILGIELCGLARRALENAEGLGQAVQIADLLGRGAAPCLGRLAARVEHRLQAADTRRSQGINAADGARQQLGLRLAGLGRSLYALGHARRAQGAYGCDDRRNAARQRRQHMLLYGCMTRAFHEKIRHRIAGQGLQQLRLWRQAGSRLAHGWRDLGNQYPAHLQPGISAQKLQHTGANRAAANQSNIFHL